MREYVERLKKIENPFKPILVGGNALELYTLGGYSTSDIDLVCLSRELVGEVLEKLGFRRFGRFWLNEELEMVVEIPDITLAGSMDRIEVFEIDDLKVYVIGKEDPIVDRLNACVFWKSKDDCRWVKELILLYYDKLELS